VRAPQAGRAEHQSCLGAAPGQSGAVLVAWSSDEVDAVVGPSCAVIGHCGLLALLLVPQPGWLAVVAAEGGGEGVGRCVADTAGDLRKRGLARAQVISRERHAPAGQVLHRGLAERSLEAPREGRPGQPADGCQFGDRPRAGGIVVDGVQGRAQPGIGRGLEPARGTAARPEAGADGEDQENVEEPVEDGLLAGLRGGQFPRQHRDDVVQGIADGRGERQDLGQRAEQPFSDVTGKPVGAAQEHRETLADPDARAGAVYEPTGPEALTVAQVAGIIAGVAGRPVSHHDIERSAWVDGAIAAGAVPSGYGVMLNWLTATIASGRGSRPNDDVRRVTGSPPASFADFAHRHAGAWALPAAHP
jgi:hypothetical protein